uniref:Uncharacterized protein n=1 Tax=Arundo donax TaxID=35708 RepID=A0A0A9DYF2_ARUDO
MQYLLLFLVETMKHPILLMTLLDRPLLPNASVLALMMTMLVKMGPLPTRTVFRRVKILSARKMT